MYRYSVDNAVTYTSEDLVLFRESPFACWMERLSLENPDHGIPPDVDSAPPGNSLQPQDELAETLRNEGKEVALVDWDAAEPERRKATLEAMRKGIDFIVNGQLALGPLSGSANLLMRTSGYSELGNYLYIPCDTQAKTTIHSAFRLCFLADLLHSLQGQLPAQMLIIRGGSDLLPLHTEDHIYHYRAVKQRFMAAMREFRKHRMPDPAESSHFGRWADCANEVMKQRALRSENDAAEQDLELEEEQFTAAVMGALGEERGVEVEVLFQNPIEARLATSKGLKVSGTLADQARALPPSPTPPASRAAPVRAVPSPAAQPSRRSIDSALENLSFIGSETGASPATSPGSAVAPVAEGGDQPGRSAQPTARAEPEPVVQPEPIAQPEPVMRPEPAMRPERVMQLEPVVQPEALRQVQPAPAVRKPHPLDSAAPVIESRGSDLGQVDRDTPGPASTALPFPGENLEDFEIDCIDDSDYRLPGPPPDFDEPAPAPAPDERPAPRPFSSSLNTAGEDRD